MTSEGRFVEVQGTAEHAAFDRPQLDQLLALATDGILVLDSAQREALLVAGHGGSGAR
jgi:ribonuclease PH